MADGRHGGGHVGDRGRPVLERLELGRAHQHPVEVHGHVGSPAWATIHWTLSEPHQILSLCNSFLCSSKSLKQ